MTYQLGFMLIFAAAILWVWLAAVEWVYQTINKKERLQ